MKSVSYNNIALFLCLIVVSLLTYKNVRSTIDPYDVSSMTIHACTYLFIGVLKNNTLKSGVFMDDLLLTTSSILIVSLLHKVIMARVYPLADSNKDGFLTTREFYEWKYGIEQNIQRQGRKQNTTD